MAASAKQCKAYRQKLKRRVRVALGERACALCGKRHRKLEAAHIAPTSINGAGRGFTNRCLDILKNPNHYRWMGKKCHSAFDRLMKAREALLPREAGVEDPEDIPF